VARGRQRRRRADEYPSNVYPWWGLARQVETAGAAPRIRFGVDEIAAVVDDRTRVVSISAVDWSGVSRRSRGARAFCRARDIRFVVDGIQAVGR
jgi:selenocysteine lyase/cysteine desulfurase